MEIKSEGALVLLQQLGIILSAAFAPDGHYLIEQVFHNQKLLWVVNEELVIRGMMRGLALFYRDLEMLLLEFLSQTLSCTVSSLINWTIGRTI